jgi:pimeloyl-ACP methyl ester carboxylesterase
MRLLARIAVPYPPGGSTIPGTDAVAKAAPDGSTVLLSTEASVTQDRAAPLERIGVATLVITSDEDRLYPPALARNMMRRIPGAELIEIKGAGHLSNIEQPAHFNEAVLDFLARCG